LVSSAQGEGRGSKQVRGFTTPTQPMKNKAKGEKKSAMHWPHEDRRIKKTKDRLTEEKKKKTHRLIIPTNKYGSFKKESASSWRSIRTASSPKKKSSSFNAREGKNIIVGTRKRNKRKTP